MPLEEAPAPRSLNILLCALASLTGAAARRVVSDEGHEVFAAPDVAEALRSLGAERPSVVLVGGESRLATAASCRQLRAAESCRDAVIIAVGSEPDDVRALIDAGADDILFEALGEEEVRGRLLVARHTAAAILARKAAQDRDVTEARATTVALRDLSESLATTLDSIGDGVIATDVAGAIVRMNPVAERLTGWTLAEARQHSPADVLRIVNGESRVTVENPIERALREGVIVKLPSHTLLTRRDGTEIPIADSCASIRAADGAVRGAVLVFRDLTAQRAAEATHAQLQKQLVFADRMASVGTLAAGVAHEINNPLTYVSSNIDTAIEEVVSISGGSPSGRMRELEAMLVEAREGVARVTKIVRALKTFSRIEEERRSVVDLVPIIELSVAMAFNEIRPRARLVKAYGRLPLVEADGARLGQVFINLLVNAAHSFEDDNFDTNEIRIVTSTNAGGQAVVEIRDTGPGISPAILGRIFDPFFTTKPLGVGTGLGLAISRNIVTSAGGELSVRSEWGRGTTFSVVLPPSLATQSSAPPPSAPVERGPVPRAAVLVVDDEPALGSTIRRVLRHHDVTALVRAQDALALIAAGKRFDVVLSDLMMPGMSGMEFHAELLRRHPEVARRVVFLTGGTFTAEANAFLDHVANERMEKPFDANALRGMIRKVTENAGYAVSLPATQAVEIPQHAVGG